MERGFKDIQAPLIGIFSLLLLQAGYSEETSSLRLSQESYIVAMDTVKLETDEELFQSWDTLKTKINLLNDNHPKQESMLRHWLETHPDDQEALFYLARVLAWQNQHADSIKIYNQLLSASPHNADYLLGKAQVYLWQTKPKEALPILDKAQALSPNYEDVYRAKLQAYNQLGQKEELEKFQAEAKSRFPDKDWTLSTRAEYYPLELEIGGGFEHLNNRYRDWSHQYLSLRKPLSQQSGIYGELIHTDRFDRNDIGIAGGTYFPLFHSKWGATIEGSISPTNHVLPHWSGGGSLHRKLPWGFVVSTGYRHTEYRDAIIEMGIYRLENYWKRLRSSYSLFQSYLHHGGQAFSHMAELDYTYGRQSHIGINGVLGEELVNLGNAGVLQTNVKATSLFGLQMIRPQVGLTYRFLIQKQGNLYTRRGFQLGLRYFF